MEVYIVQANGKVSQEAYKSLKEAQEFITRQSDIRFTDNSMETTDPFSNIKYEIHIVRVG